MKIRLRTVVAALLLTTIIPLANAARLLVSEAGNQQVAVVNRQNVETARAISMAVDQLVESSTNVLQMLAASAEFDPPNRPVQKWADNILRFQPSWRALQVRAPSGEIQLEAGEAAAGDGAPEWATTAVATSKPSVSGLLSDGENYFVVIGVPVIRDNHVTAVLGAQIDSSSLSDILRRQGANGTAVIALVDGAGKVMARNRAEENYVGKPIRQSSVDARGQMTEGSYRTTTREGLPSYTGFSRSAVTGWSAGIGFPADQVEAPIRESLSRLRIVQILLLSLAIGSALLLGQAFTRAVHSISQAALALVQGDAVRVQPSRIKEVAELTESLQEAGRIMDMRLSDQLQAQAERNRAREEQGTLLAAEREARLAAEARLADALKKS